MKKFLLSAVAALPAMAIASAPQEALYIVGLNGVAEPQASLALAFEEDRSEDDIDEEVFRYTNPEVVITESAAFTIVTADKTFSLGYDADNFLGAPNELSATSPMMYLAENGAPVNCTLKEGNYSVNLVLFSGDSESSDTWMIQFTSLDVAEETGNFYLLGFGGDDEEPSGANKFVKYVEEEDGETVTTYSIPKFYVGECPNGFTVYDIDNDVNFGGDAGTEMTDDMPFSMLSADGSPVKCSLKEGYYTVNFASMGAFSMISFLLCDDQTPIDEAEYYLLGFNGITEPTDEVKFTRTVENLEYEEDGEIYSETVISYNLNEFKITGCEDGFTVSTATGDFSFGLNPDYTAIFGSSVTQGIGFLGIYGSPLGWGMENGVYDISLTITEVKTAMISFLPHDDTGVAEIGDDTDNAPVYYNLQGVRVANPENGIFILRQGGKTSKVVIR